MQLRKELSGVCPLFAAAEETKETLGTLEGGKYFLDLFSDFYF